MDLRREDLTRTAHAPAKLNLFLDLLGRRDDGFHNVETLMIPIRLCDSVSFLPIPTACDSDPPEIKLSVKMCDPVWAATKSDAIPEGRENLIVRAGIIAAAQRTQARSKS